MSLQFLPVDATSLLYIKSAPGGQSLMDVPGALTAPEVTKMTKAREGLTAEGKWLVGGGCDKGLDKHWHVHTNQSQTRKQLIQEEWRRRVGEELGF